MFFLFKVLFQDSKLETLNLKLETNFLDYRQDIIFSHNQIIRTF